MHLHKKDQENLFIRIGFKLQYSSSSDFPRKWPGLVVGRRLLWSAPHRWSIHRKCSFQAWSSLTIFTGNHGPFPNEHWAFLWKNLEKTIQGLMTGNFYMRLSIHVHIFIRSKSLSQHLCLVSVSFHAWMGTKPATLAGWCIIFYPFRAHTNEIPMNNKEHIYIQKYTELKPLIQGLLIRQ